MSIQNYSAVDLLPGVYGAVESEENEFTQGRWENRHVVGGVVDSATTDAGNTGYTSVLRPGLLMGKVTATDKLKAFAVAGTDGTEDIYGILKKDLRMDVAGTAQTRMTGAIIVGGFVDPNFVVLSTSTSKGIVGNASEFHIRKLLIQAGFRLTDAHGEVGYGQWRKIVAKTADYTITTADRNIRFTNAGASGAVNFTLPATAYLGLEYWIDVVADQTVTLTAGTADTMIAYNDIAADSISYGTSGEKVGGHLYVYGNGSKWVVEPRLGFESQTLTIVT